MFTKLFGDFSVISVTDFYLVSLKIGQTDSSYFIIFFHQIALAVLVPLPFFINFRVIFSISTKNLAGL
jgi:hypothetical protein